jgi:hypothetical protein
MRDWRTAILVSLGVLAFGVGGAAAQRGGDRANADGTFFAAPTMNGAAVDWCADFGANCGQAGADSFCRAQGYAGASRWERYAADRTFNIGAQRYCDQRRGCGALRDVVCTGGGNGRRGRDRFEARGCGWVDGFDPNAPRDDSGRGVRDPRAHLNYALSGNRARIPLAVTNRLEALRGCLDPDRFARFYGEASVMIARIGIDRAGWRDAQDPAAPPDDAGRGILNAQGHYQYAMTGGAVTVPRTIGNRLRILDERLNDRAFAQLYADLSVMIAGYADGRR